MNGLYKRSGQRLKNLYILHVVMDRRLIEFCLGSYTTPFIYHFFGFVIRIVWYKSHYVNKPKERQIRNQFKITRVKQCFFSSKFEFDRHLEHMVSYHGMQSGLLVFLVGEFVV